MHSRFFRIYVTPFLVSLGGILPWYLFLKFVLKPKFNLEGLAVLLGVLAYVPFVILTHWMEKVSDEKEQEKRVIEWFIFYGKAFALVVSIEFLIVVMFILLELV